MRADETREPPNHVVGAFARHEPAQVQNEPLVGLVAQHLARETSLQPSVRFSRIVGVLRVALFARALAVLRSTLLDRGRPNRYRRAACR